MNKTLLITRHEFITTLKRTGFIVMTLIVPVLALLGIGIGHVVSGITKPPAEITKIGCVDQTGEFLQFTTQGNIQFVPYDTPEAATQAIAAKDIKEYFIIPGDFLTKGIILRFTTQREVTPPAGTVTAINKFMTSNLLDGKVPASTITLIESGANVVTTRITESGAVASQQAGLTSLIIPGVFSLLLALSLTFSSAYVIQGLGEEKRKPPDRDSAFFGLDTAADYRQSAGYRGGRTGTGHRLGNLFPAPVKPGIIVAGRVRGHTSYTGQFPGVGGSIFHPWISTVRGVISRRRRDKPHRKGRPGAVCDFQSFFRRAVLVLLRAFTFP